MAVAPCCMSSCVVSAGDGAWPREVPVLLSFYLPTARRSNGRAQDGTAVERAGRGGS
jgi:hypothetical protein